MIEKRITALRQREAICWGMAGVFLHSGDAHGLHDMGDVSCMLNYADALEATRAILARIDGGAA